MKEALTTGLLSIAFVSLSGCITVTEEQLTAASDSRICRYANSGSYFDVETAKRIGSEIKKRNLDCEPDHILCASYGLKKGSDKYVECRMEQKRMAAEQQQLDSLMQGMQNMHERQLVHDSIYGY